MPNRPLVQSMPHSAHDVVEKGIYRMSLNADITPDCDFLHVHVSGAFSLDELNEITTDIYQALVRHAAQKVLVDFREVSGEPTIIERFLISDFLAKEMDRFSSAGVSRATRFGCIGTEPTMDRGHFGETVAVNRGLKVKVTDSMEEVLRWLEIEPPNTPPVT
jgi:hypothetical protein